MRSLPWLVASTIVASSLGYYPFRGCADCGRPSFCPPCPTAPAYSPGQNPQIVSEVVDCPEPVCAETSEGSPNRNAARVPQRTVRLPEASGGGGHRKYPQARVLEVDSTPTRPSESTEIEEEVTSEAPFHEHSPPTPPPVSRPEVESSGEASSFAPYLQRIFGVRSRVPRKVNFKCNDERLRMIMHQSMDSTDLTVSKRLISNEAERVFHGKFDVVCSPTRLSYIANTRRYCEVTQQDVVCLAFMH